MDWLQHGNNTEIVISKIKADKRIDWLLDPAVAGIDGSWMPNKEDVIRSWNASSDGERQMIVAFIQYETYGEAVETLTHVKLRDVVKYLQSNKRVVLAIIAGRVCNLPSETARMMYLDNLMNTVHQRAMHRAEIADVIKTDKDHLIELSQKLKIDGDGKRDILKQLVAYGMQTKMHEDAKLDERTGAITTPAIYTLADPRMALLSVQELNKMDHEYSEDETSTSSTESQAERIRRLRQSTPKELLASLNSTAQKEAKKLNGTAKKVAARQVAAMHPDELLNDDE